MSNKKMNCQEKNALIKAFMEETGIQERYRLFDHIFSCPQCNADFDAVKEVWKKGKNLASKLDGKEFLIKNVPQLKEIAVQEIKKLQAQRKRGKVFLPYVKRIPVAIAGVALLVFAVLTLVVFKGSEVSEFQRRIDQWNVRLVEPRGEIEKSSITFKWTPVKEVKSYTLEILDKGLETVYVRRKIKNESYVLSKKVYNRLQNGKVYFWKVTANFKNNQKIESDLVKFQIK